MTPNPKIRLKEYQGFKAGQVVYLVSDLERKMPMVVKCIEKENPPPQMDFDIPDVEGKPASEVKIVCLRATSQKNIHVDFLPPDVLTTDEK